MRFTTEKKSAVRIEATYKHDENGLVMHSEVNHITGYALSWLHLTNNARENSSVIYSISNNSGNGIEVVCNRDYVESVKDYLEGLGFVPFYEENIIRVDLDVWGDEDFLDTASFGFDF